MGLLDDAIREHLELKRRHGGDPGEIARAEREALGPVTREAESPGHAVLAAPPRIDLSDHPHAEPVDQDPPQGDPFATEAFATHAPPAEPASSVGQPTTEFDVETAEGFDDAEEEDDDEVDDADLEEFDDAEDDVPEIGEDAPGDDDVLEETPDFLEETPEHDRLWFEQKPPRDFDFDK